MISDTLSDTLYHPYPLALNKTKIQLIEYNNNNNILVLEKGWGIYIYVLGEILW